MTDKEFIKKIKIKLIGKTVAMTENVKDLFYYLLEFLSANFISSKENSTIEGKVTFEQSPTVPITPIADTDAASKKYVDDRDSEKADLVDGKVPLEQLPTLGGDSEVFNITTALPLSIGNYYSLESAILAIDETVPEKKKKGRIITFEQADRNWVTFQFIGTSITTWLTITDWASQDSGQNIDGGTPESIVNMNTPVVDGGEI